MHWYLPAAEGTDGGGSMKGNSFLDTAIGVGSGKEILIPKPIGRDIKPSAPTVRATWGALDCTCSARASAVGPTWSVRAAKTHTPLIVGVLERKSSWQVPPASNEKNRGRLNVCPELLLPSCHACGCPDKVALPTAHNQLRRRAPRQSISPRGGRTLDVNFVGH